MSNRTSNLSNCPAAHRRKFAAIVVAVIDLGTHDDERSVFLVWELPAYQQFVGSDFSLAFDVKDDLRILVEGILGKRIRNGEQFDVADLLGKPCCLTMQFRGLVATIVAAEPPLSERCSFRPSVAPFVFDTHEPSVNFPCESWVPLVRGMSAAQVIVESDEWKQS